MTNLDPKQASDHSDDLDDANLADSDHTDITELDQDMASTSVMMTSWSGPLPPPALLQEYEDVLPGAGKEIVASFITGVDHRRELEKKALDAEIEDARSMRQEARLGQFLGFLIGVTAIISGATTGGVSGGFIGTGGVVALVAAFLYSHTRDRSSYPGNTHDESDSR